MHDFFDFFDLFDFLDFLDSVYCTLPMSFGQSRSSCASLFCWRRQNSNRAAILSIMRERARSLPYSAAES